MLPPPRRGAPPRSAWTIQAELPHWEKQGGAGCFPPNARPSSQPGRSPRPAGNPRGPKRSAEAALHELFTFKPPSPIFGAQPPHSPRLWGTFGPPSYLSFPPGAGGRTERQRPPGRAAGAGALVPRSAAITSARASPRLRVQGHTEPPRAGGPRKQDPSHRRVHRLNPPASPAKRARTALRTWHVCITSGASGERYCPPSAGRFLAFSFPGDRGVSPEKEKMSGFIGKVQRNHAEGGRAQ